MHPYRHYPGYYLVALLVLLPLVMQLPALWQSSGSGTGFVFTFLGRAAGILGLSMLLVTAMLAVRLPYLDRWFGGLPLLWSCHRLLGAVAVLLIMAHVILLVLAQLGHSLTASLSVVLPQGQWSIWAGWLGLLLLLIFIAPSLQFFGRPDYQRWKLLHRLSAPALVLAFAHGIVFSDTPALWWILLLLAVAALTWRLLLAPILARKNYRVSAVTSVARGVVEIILEPLENKRRIDYKPGQFVYFTPYDHTLAAGFAEEHPYTISSAPGDKNLRLTIKKLGDATQALQELKAGTVAGIEGPYGGLFDLQRSERKQLWFGGGIGITPFVSAVRQRQHRPQSYPDTCLLYLADRPERAYFLDEMQAVATTNDHLKIAPHYYTDLGALDIAFVEQQCPDFRQREHFICGPAGMNRHVLALLEAAGVNPALIHTEAFDFL